MTTVVFQNVIRLLLTITIVICCLIAMSIANGDELDPRLQQHEQQRVAVIKKAIQSSICIFGPGGRGGGSGVVISPDGYALTNYHVIQSCGSFMKCSMPDGVLYDAVIVGMDPTGDVAMIKLLGRNDFPWAQMGDSDQLQVGQWCFVVGNPFLLATDFQPSVSWGLVSGTHRYQYPAGTLLEYTDCIQTDAAINPGNSGGPLFSSAGELVGINGRGSFEKRGRVNVGVGYAISINQVRHFLDHLLGGRIVDHATLGATVASDDQDGVRVSNILESSDAYRRGLRYGDQIIRFANREIRSVNQFKNILGIFPKDWRVPVSVLRDGRQIDMFVRLSGIHARQELVELVQGDENAVPNRDEAPPPGPRVEDNPNADLYAFRRGFANYQFNLAMQQATWSYFLEHGDFTDPACRDMTWRLKGATAKKVPVEIVLADRQSGMRIGDQAYVLDPESELSTQLDPPDSGGLLLALHMWRKLLTQGPAKFGQMTYEGSVPFSRQDTLAHVLLGMRDVIETRFMFDKDQHHMIGLEMFPDVSVDPCEIYFKNYKRDNDLSVPSEIQWVYGNLEPQSIYFDSFEFLKPHTKEN